MKLLLVTAVEQFGDEVEHMLERAKIETYSSLDIAGHKSPISLVTKSNWFSNAKGGIGSNLFFSFTEDGKIETFFGLVERFNANLETNNPVKAVVLPIEKFI